MIQNQTQTKLFILILINKELINKELINKEQIKLINNNLINKINKI